MAPSHFVCFALASSCGIVRVNNSQGTLMLQRALGRAVWVIIPEQGKLYPL